MPRSKKTKPDTASDVVDVLDQNDLDGDAFIGHLDKFDIAMAEACQELYAAQKIVASMQGYIDRKIEAVFETCDGEVLGLLHALMPSGSTSTPTATPQTNKRKYASRREQRKAANRRRWARQWMAIVDRDGDQCGLCGGAGPEDFDHKKPKSKGGPDTLENKILSHRHCNGIKADNDYQEMKAVLTQMRIDAEKAGRNWPPTKMDTAREILEEAAGSA